jgi:prepilin-type N-terminal cleavage/methylation domain-containing protein
MILMNKNNISNMFSKKGFTLIELLVVIAIVSILSGFIYVSMSGAINSAKDAERKVDVGNLAKAIMAYNAESNGYPAESGSCSIGSTCSNLSSDIDSYLPTLPNDPNGTYYTYTPPVDENTPCSVTATLSNGYEYVYTCGVGFTTNAPLSGICGSANGSSSYTIPTESLCNNGDPSIVVGSGPWSWLCYGAYGGDDVNCTANKTIDVACGSENGQQRYTAPTTNLCDDNSTPTVNGSGPWTWDCAGINGGTGESCSAGLSVNGQCGTASKNYPSGAVDYGSDTYCSAGNPNPAGAIFPNMGGSTTWTCDGINGGSNSDTCTASRSSGVIDIAAIPGVTAPVTGAAPVTAITPTAQYTGTVSWSPSASTFAGGTVYTATITLTPKAGYTLTGVAANFFTVAGATSHTNSANSGLVTAPFPATLIPVNGACGTAQQNYLSGASGYGSYTFCSAGTASPTTPAFPAQGGSTTWACNGSNGGTNASCTATRNAVLPACTGGSGLSCTRTVDGLYTVDTFTGAGTISWTVPSGVISVTATVVGGGGGGSCGGTCSSGVGGIGGDGGAAGQTKTQSVSVTPLGAVSLTVGAGGTGGPGGSGGMPGNASAFSSISSTGGTEGDLSGGFNTTIDGLPGGSGAAGGFGGPKTSGNGTAGANAFTGAGVGGAGGTGGTGYGAGGGGGGGGSYDGWMGGNGGAGASGVVSLRYLTP